jgi:hypothetical protein
MATGVVVSYTKEPGMKTIVSLAVVGLVVGWSSRACGQATHDKMLAEMEKCAVCKHLAENPELMKVMNWETHKIDNGMLCLTTVPKEMKKEFDAVSAKMMQAIEKVKGDQKEGKPVELCSLCVTMGDLMHTTAKQQHIDVSTGAIHLCTSDDPGVVKMIHALADKAIANQKKMKEQQQRTASLR